MHKNVTRQKKKLRDERDACDELKPWLLKRDGRFFFQRKKAGL